MEEPVWSRLRLWKPDEIHLNAELPSEGVFCIGIPVPPGNGVCTPARLALENPPPLTRPDKGLCPDEELFRLELTSELKNADLALRVRSSVRLSIRLMGTSRPNASLRPHVWPSDRLVYRAAYLISHRGNGVPLLGIRVHPL
ncbi:hypothetical protein SAMN00790413_06327 [Deinococcus hopiensis KR-140]|uniref:Uncharacterized protein n=1 Tax=Deinococcus hopiensis KR-140 TaxID=695939 RepID=A0A1W1VUL0_9DEIO|nr:hypothetical protein SAMN00790413_06327 [Deinococcus hopiensis KR-140]